MKKNSTKNMNLDDRKMNWYRKKKEICLVTTSLASGGVTACFKPIIKIFLKQGFKVDIYVYDLSNNELHIDDENLNIYQLNRPKFIKRILKLLITGALLDISKKSNTGRLSPRSQKYNISVVKEMECISKEYDVAIAMHEFFPFYFVSEKVRAKKIIGWEHPRFDKLNIDYKIEKRYFDKMDKIVCVSDDCKKILAEKYPVCREKICVIHNVIDRKYIIEKSGEDIEEIYKKQKGQLNICSVCRLDNSSKRIDRMIKVAQKLKLKKIPYRWIVVGDGEDRKYLELLIKEYDVKDEFLLIGKRSNPYPYMVESDLFVLSSQYEGYPIAVCEALIIGKRAVVSDCINWEENLREGLTIVTNNEDKVIDEMTRAIINFYYQDSNSKPVIEFESQQKIYEKIIELIR